MADNIFDSEAKLVGELKQSLYKKSIWSILSNVFLCIIFLTTTQNIIGKNTSILIIGFCCILINIARLLVLQINKKNKTQFFVENHWLNILFIFSGLSWTSLFLYSLLNYNLAISPTMTLLLIIAGISAEAVGSLSNEKKVVQIFLTITLIVPSMILIFTSGGFEQKILGFLYICYAINLFITSHQKIEEIISKLVSHGFSQKEKSTLENILNSFPGIVGYLEDDQISISNNDWKKIYGPKVLLHEIDFKLGETIYNFKTSDKSVFLAEIELGEVFNNGICIINMRKMQNSLCIIFSLLEVTENKKIQLEIQQHKDLLQHNARLIDLGETIGGIAHEINNPLTVMIGKLSLLNKVFINNPTDYEKINKFFSEINISSNRVMQIVKRMKSISRQSENDPFVWESLNSILEVVNLMTLSKAKNKDIDIILDKEDLENLSLHCRPSQLEQVLINLINNSIDAIENNANKWIKLEVLNLEDIIKLRIIDSGKGIKQDVQTRMWGSFYTTKEVGKGTGLGLSISKKIIESHHGKIYIDNDCPNTCFVIELFKFLDNKDTSSNVNYEDRLN